METAQPTSPFPTATDCALISPTSVATAVSKTPDHSAVCPAAHSLAVHCLAGACGLAIWFAPSLGLANAVPLPELPRFRTRVQILSGLSPTLIRRPDDSYRITAFVPLDLELSTRLSGPLSLLGATIGALAPFSDSPCPSEAPLRPHALSALLGLRLDLNNSRDGSWWSPWVALRFGLSAQQVTDDRCQPQTKLTPAFSPRLGADLWMGKAAATFALGYDYLPTGSALFAAVGLTLRIR